MYHFTQLLKRFNQTSYRLLSQLLPSHGSGENENIGNIDKLQDLVTCPLKESYYSEVLCTCSHWSQ